jgi:hypothetical protein
MPNSGAKRLKSVQHRNNWMLKFVDILLLPIRATFSAHLLFSYCYTSCLSHDLYGRNERCIPFNYCCGSVVRLAVVIVWGVEKWTVRPRMIMDMSPLREVLWPLHKSFEEKVKCESVSQPVTNVSQQSRSDTRSTKCTAQRIKAEMY